MSEKPIVLMLMTWAGPPERHMEQTRLSYTLKAIQGIRKHIKYDNLLWHIADDGSPQWYIDKVVGFLDDCTLTSTGKGWDVNDNWNRGMHMALRHSDLVICWPDDRILNFDIDLGLFADFLTTYDDVCSVRLKPRHNGLITHSIQRMQHTWHVIDKHASTWREKTTYFEMKHRRFIDHYGYLPTNLWPVTNASAAMNEIFASTAGPDAVIPEVIQQHTEIPWGESTWKESEYSTKPYRYDAPTSTNRLSVGGPVRLRGLVTVCGAKNEALPDLAATLLCSDAITLDNIPDITDVEVMMGILKGVGITAKWIDDHCFEFSGCADAYYVPSGEQIRHSLLLLGPLLARYGAVSIPLPGGCSIGNRKFDMHIDALRAMGAEVDQDGNRITATAPNGLHGADIEFRYPTFGGTMNVMMAATLAKGTTTIHNAARNPEVVNFAYLLHKMGAIIRGIGSSTVYITGVRSLHGCSHRVMNCRMETMTWLVAAAITGGDVTVNGCSAGSIQQELQALQAIGASIEYTKNGIRIVGPERLYPYSFSTSAYPGFHTDCQPLLTTLLSLADGQSTVRETIHEQRFSHLPQLALMGAQSIVKDGNFRCPNGATGKVATIDGKELYGATVHAGGIRECAALILAGLAAEGETIIENAQVIRRGYEDIEGKLQKLGAFSCWK